MVFLLPLRHVLSLLLTVMENEVYILIRGAVAMSTSLSFTQLLFSTTPKLMSSHQHSMEMCSHSHDFKSILCQY